MGEFDLKNIGQPEADVINNVINKIAGAIGWVVSLKEDKPYVVEAKKSIIEEIAGREDIDPIERLAIISNYKRIIKEYKNRVDIVEIAMDHLKPTAKPHEVSDDWILFFFDKIRNVTEENMKKIWGAILAGEFNEPNTYTKQFLHTLSIMDSTMAQRFQKIRSSCFGAPSGLYAFVYRTNGGDIKNKQRYKELGLDFSDFRELDNLGLIKYRYPNFFMLKNKQKTLYYGNKRITLNTEGNMIKMGNVSLTDMGRQLCKIAPAEYDDRALDICVETWKKLGYNPVVEEYVES